MNRTELIAAMAEKSGLSKKDADAALKAFMETVTDQINAGEKVQLVGFGTFEKKIRPARMGRNPRTGDKVQYPEKAVASMKMSQSIIKA